MPAISPEVLKWARETAGFSLDEASKKLSLGSLPEIEGGKKAPTRPQLEKMSKLYRKSLLTLYLESPPREEKVGTDFRTLSGMPDPRGEAILKTLVQDIVVRQSLVRSAYLEIEQDHSFSLLNILSLSMKTKDAARVLSEKLNFSAADFHAAKSIDDAFKKLRNAVEATGVYVLLVGNLGSHHTNLDVGLFRGFAISDDVSPFITINENDARAAWSFTLLHEFCHIILGHTGVSGYSRESEIERFCDGVAGAFLIGDADLSVLAKSLGENTSDSLDKISEFAQQHNLSKKMIIYNLFSEGLIEAATSQKLNQMLDGRRAGNQPIRNGAPSYFVIRRHRAGPSLISTVNRMMIEGVITSTKAGKVLGVKPTGVSRVLEGAG